ncbi:MAG: branched-chain amino acid ABC transporter permease [Candidatus Bathyarchaeia archaeon]
MVRISIQIVRWIIPILLGLIVPLIIQEQSYILHLFILTFLYAFFAQSWNILMGFAGQASLGQALFFGMGSYTVGLLVLHLPHYFKGSNLIWLGIIIGGAIALLVGLAIGIITFRIRGPYFALATIASLEIVRLIFLYTENFTQGGIGIIIPHPPEITTPFFIIDFIEKIPHYYITFFMLLISCIIVYILSKSKYGLLFLSIKEDEDAASSLGVNSFRIRLLAMAISGFIAGIAGAYYAIYMGFIDPSFEPGGVLTLFTSVDAIIICLIGGIGTVPGPFIGALIKVMVGEYLRVSFGWKSGVDLVIFGALLIIFYLFVPKGISGSLSLIREKRPFKLKR